MDKTEMSVAGKVPALVCLETKKQHGIDTALSSSPVAFFFSLLKLETQDLSSLDDCFISSSKR